MWRRAAMRAKLKQGSARSAVAAAFGFAIYEYGRRKTGAQ
jgi:hypothetical protein